MTHINLFETLSISFNDKILQYLQIICNQSALRVCLLFLQIFATWYHLGLTFANCLVELFKAFSHSLTENHNGV